MKNPILKKMFPDLIIKKINGLYLIFYPKNWGNLRLKELLNFCYDEKIKYQIKEKK